MKEETPRASVQDLPLDLAAHLFALRAAAAPRALATAALRARRKAPLRGPPAATALLPPARHPSASGTPKTLAQNSHRNTLHSFWSICKNLHDNVHIPAGCLPTAM